MIPAILPPGQEYRKRAFVEARGRGAYHILCMNPGRPAVAIFWRGDGEAVLSSLRCAGYDVTITTEVGT